MLSSARSAVVTTTYVREQLHPIEALRGSTRYELRTVIIITLKAFYTVPHKLCTVFLHLPPADPR